MKETRNHVIHLNPGDVKANEPTFGQRTVINIINIIVILSLMFPKIEKFGSIALECLASGFMVGKGAEEIIALICWISTDRRCLSEY